jgi:hypothetical protein
MFFGGMNGINAFYPSDKFSHERKYKDNKILFTEFSKLDGDYDSIITTKIGLSSVNTIELSHKDRFFAFQFALANYQNPTSNTYSYMLEGYDKDWSKPSPVNTAKYNGIPPGEYTFRVRASSGKGLWNSQEMAITVIVKQAFYKSWWFIGLCFLIVLALVFGTLEYQLYRSQQQKKELQRQVKERTVDLERAMKKSDENGNPVRYPVKMSDFQERSKYYLSEQRTLGQHSGKYLDSNLIGQSSDVLKSLVLKELIRQVNSNSTGFQIKKRQKMKLQRKKGKRF